MQPRQSAPATSEARDSGGKTQGRLCATHSLSHVHRYSAAPRAQRSGRAGRQWRQRQLPAPAPHTDSVPPAYNKLDNSLAPGAYHSLLAVSATRAQRGGCDLSQSTETAITHPEVELAPRDSPALAIVPRPACLTVGLAESGTRLSPLAPRRQAGLARSSLSVCLGASLAARSLSLSPRHRDGD